MFGALSGLRPFEAPIYVPGSRKAGKEAGKNIKEKQKLPIKREEPAATAIAAGDYEKNLSECRF